MFGSRIPLDLVAPQPKSGEQHFFENWGYLEENLWTNFWAYQMTSKQSVWVCVGMCVCSSQLQYSLFDYPKVCSFFFSVATWKFGFHVDFHFDRLEFMADYGWPWLIRHKASKRQFTIYNILYTVYMYAHIYIFIHTYYTLELGALLCPQGNSEHQEDHIYLGNLKLQSHMSDWGRKL